MNDKAASDVSIRTTDGVLFDLCITEAWGMESVTSDVAKSVEWDDAVLLSKQAIAAAKARRVKHLRATRNPLELLYSHPWLSQEP